MNSWTGVGRLTKDPEVRYNGDLAIVRITVACQRRYKNSEGRYDADFIPCVAYRQTAELIGKYFHKGSEIGIMGHIQTGSYVKDGQTIYTTDIIVDNVEFVGSKGGDAQKEDVRKGLTPITAPNAAPDDDGDELPFS